MRKVMKRDLLIRSVDPQTDQTIEGIWWADETDDKPVKDRKCPIFL